LMGNQHSLKVGSTDLKTLFPAVASEADGWDPAEFSAQSNKRMPWICSKGHKWETWICNRTGRGSKCPYCAGKKAIKGENDLQTLFPELAKEADGWDPATTHAGAHAKKRWVCSEGHKWVATVKDRTGDGNCCPFCADHGFNRDKDAWIYLMERPGEQQIGITNDLKTRTKTHQSNGWNLLETVGPIYGDTAYKTDRTFKEWLKKEIGTVQGTTENWDNTRMDVSSLPDLKARSGIKTDLF